MLYSGGQILAPSRRNAEPFFFEHLLEAIENTPYNEKNYFKFVNKYVFLSSLPATDWSIAYVYRSFILNEGQIFLFLFLLGAVACFFLVMAALLVEALYKPIKDVIRETSDGKRDRIPIDEFKIIRQNSEKIKALSKSLMDALEQNGQMVSQQQYRRLLFSPQPDSDTDGEYSKLPEYSVALMEFRPITENTHPSRITILKQYVQESAMSENFLIFVDLNSSQCAVIIKSSGDEAVRILSHIIHILSQKPESEYVKQWVALSNPRQGLNHIWQSYQESLRILEYKHLHHHSNILTFKQIESVDAVTYSYPLSTENRLVHCILEGKEEALSIFDNLIRTNLTEKMLSIESIQSFVYALIGTVGRIFQELKTSPEALLYEDLSFKYLYEHWSDSVTITTLRHTLIHILEAVNRKEEHEDQRMLTDMLQFIHHNFMDDIMLNDMADYVNISPKYCGILFKQLSEQNFKDYLNRFQVERAKEMLEQNPGIKISELSLMVGFNSANSFIRVFGKYTGVTPKVYVEKISNFSSLK